MPTPRFIKNLTETDQNELQSGYRYGGNANFRMHCQAILLSFEGKTVQELMSIFGVRKNTVYDWFNNWETSGIKGLEIKPGRGRKPKLSSSESTLEAVKKSVEANRKKLSLIKADIKEVLGVDVHENTLKNFLKKTVIAGVESEKASNPYKIRKNTKKK